MTSTLLDFSQRHELALHARVVADVQVVATALNVPTMITEAFARYCAHGHQADSAKHAVVRCFGFNQPTGKVSISRLHLS